MSHQDVAGHAVSTHLPGPQVSPRRRQRHGGNRRIYAGRGADDYLCLQAHRKVLEQVPARRLRQLDQHLVL